MIACNYICQLATYFETKYLAKLMDFRWIARLGNLDQKFSIRDGWVVLGALGFR